MEQLIVVIVLVGLGYFVGSIAEKRHYRSIVSREAQLLHIPAVTVKNMIEQDADIVTFIYRPEYYKIYEWDNGDDSRGQGELIIAKHRNGSLKNVRLKFTGEFAKFTDLDYFDGGDNEDEDGDNSSMLSMPSSMNEENGDAPF